MSLTVETGRGDEQVEVQLVKKGKRLYGAYHRYVNGPLAGKLVYVAYRKHGDIFRSGESTISDAMRKGIAAWALDEETVLAARAKGCFAIAVLERDTGDRWVARIEWWFDKAKRTFINYENKGGSHQRVLPLSAFKFEPGEIKL